MKLIEPEIKLDHQQWCVFYDRRTGKVVHIHEYRAATRAQSVTAEELAEQARQAAGDRLRAEQIRVLHPPPGMQLSPRTTYRVDLNDGALVAAGAEPMDPKRLPMRKEELCS